MDEKGKGNRKMYSGFGGISEAGGTIPWLIIKTVQAAIKRLRKSSGKGESNENNA